MCIHHTSTRSSEYFWTLIRCFKGFLFRFLWFQKTCNSNFFICILQKTAFTLITVIKRKVQGKRLGKKRKGKGQVKMKHAMRQGREEVGEEVEKGQVKMKHAMRQGKRQGKKQRKRQEKRLGKRQGSYLLWPRYKLCRFSTKNLYRAQKGKMSFRIPNSTTSQLMNPLGMYDIHSFSNALTQTYIFWG